MEAAQASPGGLAEAAAIPWRRRVTPRALKRDGRRWTLWTVGVVLTFGLPTAVLVALKPIAAPAAAFLFAHGVAVLYLQAGRGARAVVPIGSARSVGRRDRSDPDAEGVALGLLGDLVGHEERELLQRTGLALQRGRFGVWLVGEKGALMVWPGGHRVDCWCVRVAEPGDLPAGDRVAHLLLALREDEEGFATVANFNFSGAPWRVRMRMDERSRPALDRAKDVARHA